VVQSGQRPEFAAAGSVKKKPAPGGRGLPAPACDSAATEKV
jgi:hypothetical protein